MNTSTSITTSAKDAAVEALAAYAAWTKAKTEADASLTTLDSLPKTKTGKDTKAVKEAKAAVAHKSSGFYHEYYRKADLFGRAFLLSVIEANRMTATPFSVENALSNHGFTHSPEMTGKVIETLVSINQHNKGVERDEDRAYYKRDREHGFIFNTNEGDRVYINAESDLHLVIRFNKDDYSYRIRYYGGKPVLTPFGLAYFRDHAIYGASTFDNDILSDLRISGSGIDSEFGPDAAKMFAALVILVTLADTLMTLAPFVDTSGLHPQFDQSLMESVAGGGALVVARMTKIIEGRKHRFNKVIKASDLGDSDIDLVKIDVEAKVEIPHGDDSEEV